MATETWTGFASYASDELRRLEGTPLVKKGEFQALQFSTQNVLRAEQQFRSLLKLAPRALQVWEDARNVGFKLGLPARENWPSDADCGAFSLPEFQAAIGHELVEAFCATYGANSSTFLDVLQNNISAETFRTIAAMLAAKKQRIKWGGTILQVWKRDFASKYDGIRRMSPELAELSEHDFAVVTGDVVYTILEGLMLQEGMDGQRRSRDASDLAAMAAQAPLSVWKSAARQFKATQRWWSDLEKKCGFDIDAVLSRTPRYWRRFEAPKGPINGVLSAIGLPAPDAKIEVCAKEITASVGTAVPNQDPRHGEACLRRFGQAMIPALIHMGVIEGVAERLNPVYRAQLGATIAQSFTVEWLAFARTQSEQNLRASEARCGAFWWAATEHAWPMVWQLLSAIVCVDEGHVAGYVVGVAPSEANAA